MSTFGIVTIGLLVWAAFGPVLALLMGRRGHDPMTWTFLGLLLGPLAAGVAVGASSDRFSRPRRPMVVEVGRTGGGIIDVLVGVDGSPSSERALRSALDFLGERIGRLGLLWVVDVEADQRPDVETHAMNELGRFADLVKQHQPAYELASAPGSKFRPQLVVGSGRPAEVIEKMARDEEYDIVVIGCRGSGMSTALLGSVAVALAGGLDVPVLVGPRAPAEQMDHAHHAHRFRSADRQRSSQGAA